MDIENLALDVHHLVRPGGLLDRLETLVPDQATHPRDDARHHKLTGSPAPWHGEAALALLDVHEGARRLEASLRMSVSGRLGQRRGCSDGNTRSALKSCVRLTEALDEEQVKLAARIVGRWVTSARQIRDIDIADRWEPLPRQPGMLPPVCDYCETYSLRWNRRTGEVRCVLVTCLDESGHRPVARMVVGRYTGEPALAWRDGRNVVYTDQVVAA